MQNMFYVRSAPAHAAHPPVGPPLRVTYSTAPTPSRLLARLPPSQHASLWTRQYAQAFNQPVNFDTSSVTSMQYMFRVRSAPAHATHPPVGPTPRVT